MGQGEGHEEKGMRERKGSNRTEGEREGGSCTSLSDSRLHMVTVLSKEPLAKRLPSQLQATEWTCRRDKNI